MKIQVSGLLTLSFCFALVAVAKASRPSFLRRLQCQTQPPQCFSADSKVFVRDVGPVRMAELSVGQEILVGLDTTSTNDGGGAGNDKYQRVYAFAHREEDRERSFLQIYTDTSDSPLEVTSHHLIFLHGKRNPIRADAIREGDILQGYTPHKEVIVTKIGKATKVGLYNPLTPDGKLVVEGVTASSYISLQEEAVEFVEFKGGISSGFSQHHVIHMSLSPFRIICQYFPSFSSCQPQKESGIPKYIERGLRLSEWLDELGYVAQRTMFWPYLLSVGSSMLLEYGTLGGSFSPLDLLFANDEVPSIRQQEDKRRLQPNIDDDADDDDCAPADDDTLPIIPIACFSYKSTVFVQGKGEVMMKDLKVNDCIITKGLPFGGPNQDTHTSTSGVQLNSDDDVALSAPLLINAGGLRDSGEDNYICTDDETPSPAPARACFSYGSTVTVPQGKGGVTVKNLQGRDGVDTATRNRTQEESYQKEQIMKNGGVIQFEYEMGFQTELSSKPKFATPFSLLQNTRVDENGISLTHARSKEQAPTCQVVYAFAHRDEASMAEFLVFLMNNSKTLEVTPNHLVYLQGKAHPVPARALRVGDVLQGATESQGWAIRNITTEPRVGMYAPLTSDGTFMVDGVKASSYVSLQAHPREYVEFQKYLLSTRMSQHDLIHMWLIPYRAYCLHISGGCDSVNPNGYPDYVEFGLKFADKWGLFPTFLSLSVGIVILNALELVLYVAFLCISCFGMNSALTCLAVGWSYVNKAQWRSIS